MLEGIMRKLTIGLIIANLTIPISCRAISRGAGLYTGVKIGEALLGPRKVEVIHGDKKSDDESTWRGKRKGMSVTDLGYNPVMDPDLTDIRPSPDRKKVVFSKLFGNQGEIFRANSDGTCIERLTYTLDASERTPTYSPDGKKIAFFRFKPVLTKEQMREIMERTSLNDLSKEIRKVYQKLTEEDWKKYTQLVSIDLEKGGEKEISNESYKSFLRGRKQFFSSLDGQGLKGHYKDLFSKTLKWSEDSTDVEIVNSR